MSRPGRPKCKISMRRVCAPWVPLWQRKRPNKADLICILSMAVHIGFPWEFVRFCPNCGPWPEHVLISKMCVCTRNANLLFTFPQFHATQRCITNSGFPWESNCFFENLGCFLFKMLTVTVRYACICARMRVDMHRYMHICASWLCHLFQSFHIRTKCARGHVCFSHVLKSAHGVKGPSRYVRDCFLILSVTFWVIKQMSICSFTRVLEGLERSGDLIAFICTYSGTSPTPWCRQIMAPNPGSCSWYGGLYRVCIVTYTCYRLCIGSNLICKFAHMELHTKIHMNADTNRNQRCKPNIGQCI